LIKLTFGTHKFNGRAKRRSDCYMSVKQSSEFRQFVLSLNKVYNIERVYWHYWLFQS